MWEQRARRGPLVGREAEAEERELLEHWRHARRYGRRRGGVRDAEDEREVVVGGLRVPREARGGHLEHAAAHRPHVRRTSVVLAAQHLRRRERHSYDQLAGQLAGARLLPAQTRRGAEIRDAHVLPTRAHQYVLPLQNYTTNLLFIIMYTYIYIILNWSSPNELVLEFQIQNASISMFSAVPYANV